MTVKFVKPKLLLELLIIYPGKYWQLVEFWCLFASEGRTQNSCHNIIVDMQKRQLDGDGESEGVNVDLAGAKRAKRESASTDLVAFAQTSQALTVSRNSVESGRTSSLYAPEVSLHGHEGAIYSIDFDPSGKFLCSASFDKQICKPDTSCCSHSH